MVKINNKQHITKDGVVKRNPSKVGRYRVYWAEPTTFGYEKVGIKFYSNKTDAEKALLKLRDQLLDPDVSEESAVHMEDLVTGAKRGYIVDDSDDRGYQEF